MSRTPEVAELVTSTAEWLEGIRDTALTGAEQFHARVAVNVLRIVERELRSTTDPDELLVPLVGLGPEPATRLAEQIAAGDLHVSATELLATLHGYAVRRLEVDNPRYLLAADRNTTPTENQ